MAGSKQTPPPPRLTAALGALKSHLGSFTPVYQKDLGLPKRYNGVAQLQLSYTFGGHQ